MKFHWSTRGWGWALLDFPDSSRMHHEDYAKRMQRWIEMQPIDVQPVLRVKFKLNSKLKKRHSRTSPEQQSKEPPSKKPRTAPENDELQPGPSSIDTNNLERIYLNGAQLSTKKTNSCSRYSISILEVNEKERSEISPARRERDLLEQDHGHKDGA